MNELARVTIGIAVLAMAGTAQSESLAANEIRRVVDDNVDAAVTLYRDFLSLPNDANHPDDIEKLVVWMEVAFGERGFETRRIPTDGSPALYAARLRENASKTVLVYLQADGQPVDAGAWAQADPYLPVLKARDSDGNWHTIDWSSIEERYDPDWRVFARSASDSKGPMTQFLMAIELLDELGAAPDYNLKVIVDTE
ncbi:MAG: hypothetical protein KAJ57_06525, partial [Woeseiaceae bacterium]|nr:hypothetical protein [Woeseiaceae bacterium]